MSHLEDGPLDASHAPPAAAAILAARGGLDPGAAAAALRLTRGVAGAPAPAMVATLREEAARRTRSVCHALAAQEQDLFLAFAAALRLARAEGGGDGDCEGGGGADHGGGGGGAGWEADGGGRHVVLDVQPHGHAARGPADARGAAGEDEREGRALCELVGGWLVHPLGGACAAAREAAAAFLWYLVLEDSGYG